MTAQQGGQEAHTHAPCLVGPHPAAIDDRREKPW